MNTPQNDQTIINIQNYFHGHIPVRYFDLECHSSDLLDLNLEVKRKFLSQ